MKTQSFDTLFAEVVDEARKLGAVDGDMPKVRQEVYTSMAGSGWGSRDASGTLTASFVSDTDRANAVQAALVTVRRVVAKITHSRAQKANQKGYVPSKISASVSGSLVDFASSPQSYTSSLPGLATPGTVCSKCGGPMVVVGLVNDKSGIFCQADRVVLPL